MGKFIIESRTGALYIKLPVSADPKPVRQVILSTMWQGQYDGPYIVFDVDASDRIIGIEIVSDEDVDGDE